MALPLLIRIFYYFDGNFENVADVKESIFNQITACLTGKIFDAVFLLVKRGKDGIQAISTDFQNKKHVTGAALIRLKKILAENKYI